MAVLLTDGDQILRSSDSKFHFEFKISIVGDSLVGKSALVHAQVSETAGRWHQIPSSVVETVGIRFEIQDFTASGKEYRCVYWDAPGSERYMRLTSQLCAGATAVVFVFDVCSLSSFEHLDDWLASSTAPIRVLIGNKTDLPKREVERERAEAYAKRNNMMYFETSVVENKGVEDAFAGLMESIISTIPDVPDASGLIKKGIKMGILMHDDSEYRDALFNTETTSFNVDWLK